MIKRCVECNNEFKTYKTKVVRCSLKCFGIGVSKRKRTKEHNDKISKSHVGVTKVWSEEKRRWWSEKNKGIYKPYLHTPEVIEKIKKALTGRKNKKHTEETKQKIRESKLGSKNPNWKNNSTSKKESLRGHSFYKQWRKSVFERDNYTCVKCGVRSGNGSRVELEADHIYQLKDIVSPYTELDRDEFIKKVWELEIMKDINNGRTLCKPCHKEVTFSKRFYYELKPKTDDSRSTNSNGTN